MNVLACVYPSDAQNWEFDSLLAALSKASTSLCLVDCDERPGSMPNWSHLILVDESNPKLQFEFVVEKNDQQTIEKVTDRHHDNRNLPVVRKAKKYIRSTVNSTNASKRDRQVGLESYRLVVWVLACVSSGVVDLPEEEQLYSAFEFARFANEQ